MNDYLNMPMTGDQPAIDAQINHNSSIMFPSNQSTAAEVQWADDSAQIFEKTAVTIQPQLQHQPLPPQPPTAQFQSIESRHHREARLAQRPKTNHGQKRGSLEAIQK